MFVLCRVVNRISSHLISFLRAGAKPTVWPNEVENLMRTDIYWIASGSIKPGKYEEFLTVIEQMANVTRDEEGSISYEFNVNDEHTVVQVFEHFRDDAAAVHHLTKTLPLFGEAYGETASIDGLVVYGTPQGEAKEILDSLGSVYLRPVGGFTSKA
jgi:quinol monooxygenase YgiN